MVQRSTIVGSVNLAERIRKARFEGICPTCRGAIDVGQQIGLNDGKWHHSNCLLFPPDDLTVAWTAPDRPLPR